MFGHQTARMKGATKMASWSATHTVSTQLVDPATIGEVEHEVRGAHAARAPLRLAGSALSPNGIALSGDKMMSLRRCARVLHVDAPRRRVTVEAGITVAALVDALLPHELTLVNYGSISAQQVGGIVQCGVHGSGARIPPLDDTVAAFVLYTPTGRRLLLRRGDCRDGAAAAAMPADVAATPPTSRDDEERLFNLARVGLGCVGVVTHVTLLLAPAHYLCERTVVASAAAVLGDVDAHRRRLRRHRHVRYMWLPHTDDVVIVTIDAVRLPPPALAELAARRATSGGGGGDTSVDPYTYNLTGETTPPPPSLTASQRCAPMRNLLLRCLRTRAAADGASGTALAGVEAAVAAAAASLSHTQLRDLVLHLDATDVTHVVAVAKAEAAMWRLNQVGVDHTYTHTNILNTRTHNNTLASVNH
jgi:L-galactono-1,4-lactone dehydrogenase